MSVHPVTGEILTDDNEIYIFPASHYTAGPERMNKAISAIEAEVAIRIPELESQGKLLEAQRIKMRTSYDIEMMQNLGFCSGIENYSRHIDGREAGSAPNCLLDYFPEDFLLVIDESHVTVPQIGAMYEGDASRKRTLVEHGFRLPSAMDNRPLKWPEFLDRVGQTVYLSATPGPFELGVVNNDVVEQVIRPTGLVDPEIIVKHPVKHISVSLLQQISHENLQERSKELAHVEQILQSAHEEFEQILQIRHVELAMRAVPEEIKRIKSDAVNEVFKHEINALDPQSREVLEKVLGYVEKKYIAGPMKLAKEILVKNG
jgi:excinuclease ABC subunit B